MEIVDGEWIKRRLTGKRGEKAALARALGIKPDMVTKILTGERQVQPSELGLLLEFFNETIGPATASELDATIIDLIGQVPEEDRHLAVDYLRYLASRHLKDTKEK